MVPSVTTLAKLIKANNIAIDRVIEGGQIFRGYWYITKPELAPEEEPTYEDYRTCEIFSEMIKCMKIQRPLFLFDLNGKYLYRFNGILEAEAALRIRHEKLKKHALSGEPYKEYIISFHRVAARGKK